MKNTQWETLRGGINQDLNPSPVAQSKSYKEMNEKENLEKHQA
jgi:hypothetical protein